MRSRYPSASSFSYSFGPGPLTPAIKALIAVNVVVFLASLFVPLVRMLGLRPADVVQHFAAWQLVTYMFLHAGPMHLLFNMLALWMFGVELERMWGTTYFTKFYFITGVCAGLTQLLLGILPLPFAGEFYGVVTIGASGRHLRHPDGVRDLLPQSPHFDVRHLPAAGARLRHHHGRALTAVRDRRRRWRGAHGASGRDGRRLSVSQGDARAPVVGDSVPISQVAYQSLASSIRRLSRRAGRRCRSSGALKVVGLWSFVFRFVLEIETEDQRLETRDQRRRLETTTPHPESNPIARD
jgi:hypothetical protein